MQLKGETRRDFLVSLLMQAQKDHHDYEQNLGHKDEDWATWYADHMSRVMDAGQVEIHWNAI